MTRPDPTGRSFELDRFQLEAIEALDAGESVLVAAPTGAGKTVVAEHAVQRALQAGAKAFYTTPIKALSNQKYRDLVDRHGAERIGLLTGDNTIDADAPVVVMTTEVLRNMIYGRSRLLSGLAYVVLDEVHYLQDTYRGPTWEEVIIHLPSEVRLVCLSATVSNVAELAEWLRTVRGPTRAVVETRRPVELVNLYGVHDRPNDRLVLAPVLVDGRPNPKGERYDREPSSRSGPRARGAKPFRRYATPDRVELLDELRQRGLLPAIYFIFSRAGCDEAVRQTLAAGRSLTTAEERSQITAIAAAHTDQLSEHDLTVLGHDRWLDALLSGVAAHHAGMVPPFKEAVEACFAAGLVRLVYATETLALGVNMPARTVVIDKLTKFTGDGHEMLTPGQFTQITGRAGRRGLDDIGHAVVLWSPFVSFSDVSNLVTSTSFPLRSAFRPTYNMAANLVRAYDEEYAHHLLRLSFGQFQTDRTVVTQEQRATKLRAEVEELAQQATCEHGDVGAHLDALETTRSARSSTGSTEVLKALRRLKPGQVIRFEGAGPGGALAVVSVAHRRGGAVRIRVVTPARRIINFGEGDVDAAPEVLGKVPLPTPFAPRSSAFQRELASSLAGFSVPRRRRGPNRVRDVPTEAAGAPDCADLDRHLRAERSRRRRAGELERLERATTRSAGSLAAQFDAVLDVLRTWGHVSEWQLTERGERLVRIFHECDLVIAEALDEGAFDGLRPPEVAALASCFVYEHRSSAPAPEPWFPTPELARRWEHLERLATRANADEHRRGLPLTRRPDPGFMGVAHGWASGGGLAHVLEEEDLTGGDFVRTTKVLLDLLHQLAVATAVPATASAASSAAQAMLRDVVEASSTVGTMAPGEATERR